MAIESSIVIRDLRSEDWPSVRDIYAAGIATGNATFETEVPTWERWDAGRRPDLRLVALDGPQVVGWVAASNVSSRPAYAGVVEHSVYVDPARQGLGVGRSLLDALIDAADRAGIWTIQSAVFPENTASLALHERAGFRVIGTRERIGRLHGIWRDTVLIERRSARVGRD